MDPVNRSSPPRTGRLCPKDPRVCTATLALFAVLAGGCAPAPEPTLPPPVPRVAVSPSLEGTVATWVRTYRVQVGVPEFDLVPVADAILLESVAGGEAVLAITSLEPPQGWFATPLVREGLAVVSHPSNPVRDLTLEALTDLYTGRVANWSVLDGAEVAVQPVVLPPGDALRRGFDAAVLDDARVWPGALIASSPAGVMEVVRSDRGAIGYVPVSQLSGSLGVVRVEGAEPQCAGSGIASYPLCFTIAATAPEEPDGAVRDFLVWLQAGAASGR